MSKMIELKAYTCCCLSSQNNGNGEQSSRGQEVMQVVQGTYPGSVNQNGPYGVKREVNQGDIVNQSTGFQCNILRGQEVLPAVQGTYPESVNQNGPYGVQIDLEINQRAVVNQSTEYLALRVEKKMNKLIGKFQSKTLQSCFPLQGQLRGFLCNSKFFLQ